MLKVKKQTSASLAKLLPSKSKTSNPYSPVPPPVRSAGKKAKLAPKSAREMLKKERSGSSFRPGSDSSCIEEALKKSIELLEFVQAQKTGKDSGSGMCRTPERRPSAMCHSSTQTTEDKSTQVSLTSPSFQNSVHPKEEIRELKRSLHNIARRLKDLSGFYRTQSSGTEEMLTFRSPETEELASSFRQRRACFASSLNGPLLSDQKPKFSHSPSDAPQDLHLSSLASGSFDNPPSAHNKRLLNIAMDELELS